MSVVLSRREALLLAASLSQYFLGALAYAFKRPNPWPTVFGFHEVLALISATAAQSPPTITITTNNTNTHPPPTQLNTNKNANAQTRAHKNTPTPQHPHTSKLRNRNHQVFHLLTCGASICTFFLNLRVVMRDATGGVATAS